MVLKIIFTTIEHLIAANLSVCSEIFYNLLKFFCKGMQRMIGERLAEVRKDHNDRQADLAEKLNVTLYTVRSWEQEKSSPSHDMLVKICRLYHVSSDYLLGLSDRDPLLYESEPAAQNARDVRLLHEFAEYLQKKQ